MTYPTILWLKTVNMLLYLRLEILSPKHQTGPSDDTQLGWSEGCKTVSFTCQKAWLSGAPLVLQAVSGSLRVISPAG